MEEPAAQPVRICTSRVRWQGVYLDPARLLQLSLP